MALLDTLSPENPILLIGPPGFGKTARPVAWARENGYDLILEQAAHAMAIDYRGALKTRDEHAEWLPLGNLRRCLAADSRCVVLIDDVGQAMVDVQAAVAHLVNERIFADRPVGPNTMFVLTSNRAADRSGAKRILAMLKNRVQEIELTVSATAIEETAQWMLLQPGIHPHTPAYCRFRGVKGFAGEVPEHDEPFCTPRSLEKAGRLLARGLGELHHLAGWIGKAAAADFLAYHESIGKMDDIESILARPQRVKTKDPGLLHAIVCMAALKAQTHAHEIVLLANHLGGGWGVSLMSGAADVWPELKKSSAFQDWALHNRDVLL